MIKFIFFAAFCVSYLQATEPTASPKKSLLSHFKKKTAAPQDDHSLKDTDTAVQKFEERLIDCYKNIETILDSIGNAQTKQSKTYLEDFKDFLTKKYMYFWNASKKGDVRSLGAMCKKESLVIESFTKSAINPKMPISKSARIKNIELHREYSNYIKNNKQYRKSSLRDKVTNIVRR